MKSLNELALKYNVDKATRHNYIPIYEEYMSEVRNSNVCLFEIGIDQGKSIKMWREYFPEAAIIGIDIKESSIQYFGDRVYTFVADQKNKEDLKHIIEIFPSFDFIIDDGSHKSYDQVFSFLHLYPTLKSGGVYFIEDLHTSFIPQFNRSRYEGKTCFDYLMGIAETLNKRSVASIEYVKFCERMAIIKKKNYKIEKN